MSATILRFSIRKGWHCRPRNPRNSIIMDMNETKLNPPENFKFPFTPYDIQKDFMFTLYETLEGKKLGIFESPTGTGKSMSLICGSLAWLLDHEERTKKDLNDNIAKLKETLDKSSKCENWLEAHEAQAKNKQKRDLLQDQFNKIIRKEQKLDNIRIEAKNLGDVNKGKKFKIVKSVRYNNKENEGKDMDEVNDLVDEDDILLDGNELNEKLVSDGESDNDNDGDIDNNDKEEYNGVKIYFCSRTHSQLSQLVHEIQKSPYSNLNISVVTLSSRQNYCINNDILRMKNLSLINERCQDLHNKNKVNITKASSKGEKLKKQKLTSGCLFHHNSNLENMKLKILTEIKDVEDVVQLGKDVQGCPYYSSRLALPDAKVILVPYNTILHRNTRTASGINLKDSIVIIDEAHNLLDAIANMHSSLLTGYQLIGAHSQLVQYRDKFHDRFTPYNLLRINQIIYILKNFIYKIGGKINVHPNFPIAESNSITLETLADFTVSCEIDNINLFDILEFSKRSRICQKLHGFTLKYKPSVVVRSNQKGVSSFLKSFEGKKEEFLGAVEETDYIEGNPLLAVVSFLESLTNHFEDGRIVCRKNKTIRDSFIKFLLLNPAAHFSDIVKEARSVVLAGGTMQPISEFKDQLFLMAGASPDRISTFTCGHVIQSDHILPIIVTAGPTGKTFDFSYQYRNDPKLSEELGRLLINVCNVVPSGLVCFFPSYDYESYIYQELRKHNFIAKLENKKKVLREPKKSNEVDDVLREYTKLAKKGAILFSVVGGKLSEGLNFNDELGRCVLVVGLPYPNLKSPELKEKMNYLNTKIGPNTGKEYYENLCMKAVNQSIGRSVRHKDDYASVLLVDHRYSRNQCKNALPNWIQESLSVETKFGSVIASLAKFFNSKRGV